MLRLFSAVMLVALACVVCPAQPFTGPLLFSRVAVNRTHVAFSYAGDLWVVERAGGEARRLTTHAGEDNFPCFSPDGSQLAFSRQINNDWDIYVMPAEGGEARRLTYMPEDDLAAGWTPDGRSVLFNSHRDEEGVIRLWKIGLDGVTAEPLPLPQAYAGSYSPDGSRVAYQPMGFAGEYRLYRGGMLSPVWVANLSTGALEKLPHGNHNDRQPMWAGNKIYFVSDRTGVFNLFSYDLGSRQTRQLTTFDRFGIRWAGAGGDAVAFVRDGRIHLHDMKTGETRAVEVRVSPDTAEWKERKANAARAIESATLSNDGKQVVFGARGEVLTLDADGGAARNLTETSGAAERYPVPSPNGRLLAYFSDESGEYQLHVRPVAGDEARKINVEAKPSFYRELNWSPDSKRVAFIDRRLGLWVADIERGTAARADVSRYTWQEEYSPSWSPDGRWLAYSKYLMPNRVRAVFVYDTRDGRARQITDGRTHAESPVFDASGKYLYFVSSANAGTSDYGWAVLGGMRARPLVTRSLHAFVLRSDAQAPLLPNNQPNPEAKLGERETEVRIDFDEIGERVVDLPQPARDYAQLASAKPGVLHVLVTEWPKSPGFTSNPASTLYRYDLAKPNAFEKLVEEVNGFELSRDGERLLYAKGRGDWFVVSSDSPPKPDEGKLDLRKLEVSVDPRAEWRQIYREAWRLMREIFYDPNHHGQNLAALEQHFSAYLPSVTRRADLNALMNQMLGHVSVSHLFVAGGDTAPPATAPTRIALLGADYEVDRGRYRFKRVVRASQYDDAGGAAVAPLDRPGARVRDGEYLLAVNGQNVDASKNVYTYFEVKGPGPLKITVGPSPTGEGSRTLTVFPVPGENVTRRAAWAERNRRLVEQMSGGRLGYVYVSDYSTGGINNFIRGLVGHADKAGVIIDQRFNGGGITPDYLIEWLRRRPLYYYRFREGDDQPTPTNPGPGATVLLTNEHNGSAAETFAFMYKLARVGPVVGMRTFGAGIGPSGFTPGFIDGGRAQIPNRAAYNPDGTNWGIENLGVAPDFPVELTPQDWAANRDPQLLKAVQVALEEIKKNPQTAPKRPRFPVHR